MNRAETKPKRSIFVRLLVMCVSVYMVVSLSGLYCTLNENRIELKKLEKIYDNTQVEIEELNTVLSDKSETKLIIKAARIRLGFIFPGEEIYASDH